MSIHFQLFILFIEKYFNMNRIFLNESHIRQLVKETLENLILGEDDDSNINPIEIIKNSTITYVDFIDIDGDDGVIRLVLSHNSLDSIDLEIKFTIHGYLTDYDSGDYYTPPSGGEFEITDINAYSASLFIDGDEENIDVRINKEFINTLLNKYWDKIYENVDPSYFKDEGPDPDWEYEFRNNK